MTSPIEEPQDARQRYTDTAEGWLLRFGIRIAKARSDLSGCAWVKDRKIEAPWPATSRKRLYIVAHEIGHVVLNHVRTRPIYVQEFEAEMFAHQLMRGVGISVPREMTARAKRYVRSKIGRAHRRFAEWIDPDIAEWAGDSVGGINWCTPPEKQKHYHKNSMRRVSRALSEQKR